jgi:hypothetical protein
MSKQTAVEWLVKKLTNRQNGIFDGFPHLSLDEIYSQAKAIEKEQIIDSFGVGCQVESTRLIGYHKMAEQYYNENYGGDK